MPEPGRRPFWARSWMCVGALVVTMGLLKAFADQPFNGSPLATQLWTAAQRRASVCCGTDAVRLHDVDADDVCGATIECLGLWVVLNTYDDRENESALAQALMDLGARGVYLKRRTRADLRRTSRLDTAPRAPIAGEAAPESHRVNEYGLCFEVRLDDGLSTGLFLDQRANRAMLRQDVAGARVLNLFSYTGAFSIAAAAGGATLTTSVDLSATVLGRLSKNVRLNSQPVESHRVLKADATRWLARAVRRGDQFERIVLDPPSFASMGRDTFSVAKDYVGLAADCLRLLVPSGKLLAVTNHRKTSLRDFKKTLCAAAELAGSRVLLQDGVIPEDCGGLSNTELPTKSVWITKL